MRWARGGFKSCIRALRSRVVCGKLGSVRALSEPLLRVSSASGGLGRWCSLRVASCGRAGSCIWDWKKSWLGALDVEDDIALGMGDATETNIIRTSILSYPMQLGKKGYISQISLYLNNKDYQNAYNMSKQFIAAFPDELIARFLLAESAFWAGQYHEAALEAHKAFNKATEYDDMLSCALVAGSAHFQLREYQKGMEILKHIERRKSSADLEKMLFAYSMAMHNPQEAAMHLNELHRMNQAAAIKTIDRYFKD
jgi:hypothetical protein